MPQEDAKRLQFDLSEERLDDLKRVMVACGISKRKDLFNNALTLFEWAVKEVQAGNTIASVNEAEKKYRELQMPVLNHAAHRSTVSARAAVVG